jgi:hypothetical protein
VLIGQCFQIPTVSYNRPLGASVKNDTADNLLHNDRKKKNDEQPTHKTAHLQAPTHKPMLQLAKELFSCRRTSEY